MLSFTAFWGSSPIDGCCGDGCCGDVPWGAVSRPVSRSTVSFFATGAAVSIAIRLGVGVECVAGDGVLVVGGGEGEGVVERLVCVDGLGTANICRQHHMTLKSLHHHYIVTTNFVVLQA